MNKPRLIGESIDQYLDRLGPDEVVTVDLEECAAMAQEDLDFGLDEVGAMLAQGYIALHERGEITESHLAAILEALSRIDEIPPDEFDAILKGGVASEGDGQARTAGG